MEAQMPMNSTNMALVLNKKWIGADHERANARYMGKQYDEHGLGFPVFTTTVSSNE